MDYISYHVSIAVTYGVVIEGKNILNCYQIHAFLLYYAKWPNTDVLIVLDKVNSEFQVKLCGSALGILL